MKDLVGFEEKVGFEQKAVHGRHPIMPKVRQKKRDSLAGGFAALFGLSCLVGLALTLGGCYDSNPTKPEEEEGFWDLADCDLDPAYLVSGGTGFDGIPAISEPDMVNPTQSEQVAYLRDEHRVVGIVVGGQPLAFPLSALWFHEIVNLNQAGVELVVTHASLTGATRVFRRSAAAGADFGVSGFLYQNNLLFFDRAEAPSLWAQLTGDGRCGPLYGFSSCRLPLLGSHLVGMENPLSQYSRAELSLRRWTSLGYIPIRRLRGSTGVLL